MPVARHRAYHHSAALIVALVGHAAAASAAVHDVETHHFENGLTLHVAGGHAAPVAAVQAWVGVGSADETPPLAGVAHVVEHMLFKGSAAYGLGELTRTLEHAGGEINAWTAFDHTVYHAVLGRDHVDAAIEAMGDALLEPRVEPDELARERAVILQEIRQGTDDPGRSVVQSLFATAYVEHPYRRPVIGTPESVQGIRERELVDFFRTYYVADNLTLVVAGDVDGARVRRAVERRFRAMPSGRPPRRAIAEPAQTAPRAVATFRDLGEAYLSVGFHVPPARHPDVAALDVAAILLGQTESARLPRELRDRDQIATSAHAHLHALRDPGLLVLSATATAANAPRTIGALVDQARALAEVDGDELDRARITAEAAFVRQLETAQGRARAIGWNATVNGDPQFGHVYLDRVRAVRRHDLARVIHRYVRPHNASVAAILPTPSRASAGRVDRRTAFARDAERRVRKVLSPSPPPATPVEKRVVLPSGTVLVVRRDPAVPIVAMRAVWRGGQRLEDRATFGASTLAARLVTRGCGALDAAQVADRIDRLGGSLGAVTGRNSFGVAAEWLSRTWKPGFELLADCALAPTFPTAELERERRLLLDDQELAADNPSQTAFQLFSETLYGPDHPYGRDVLGTPAAIGAITRAQLLAFYRANYAPERLVIAVVGDVDVDEVIAQARARFGAKAKAPAAAKPAIVVPKFDGKPAEAREVYRTAERAQAHLVLGFPGATIDAPDRFALEVLVAILGGQSGRLFGELREKQALVYRVSAHSIEGVDPGFVAIYLSCAPDKADVAIAAVNAELAKLRAGGVTADELVRAQRYLIGTHQIAMQRRSAVANAMAYHEAYGLGWQTWSHYDDAITTVRREDVAAAIASYLRDDRAITATVQPSRATPAAIKRSKLPTPPARPTPRKAAPVPRPPRRRGEV